MAKKQTMCKPCGRGASPIGHIFYLVGIYVLTGGLLQSLNYKDVFTSAIFWGILLMSMGACSAHVARRE